MISIIIISKNEQNYLPRLLSSIRRQEIDEDFEIILADAKSTDKTREIAELFNCKIIEGGFPSTGRNRGFRECSGDLILFLDSDVELPNYFLRDNVNEFRKKELGCATTIYLPITYFRFDRFAFFIYNWLQRISQFGKRPLAGGFCIFCSRDVYEKINGFNENFQMCDDVDFVTRASKVSKFRIIKSVPIFCDTRRLDKDGRWQTLKNYVKGFAYYSKNGLMEKAPFDYELQGGVNVREIGKK